MTLVRFGWSHGPVHSPFVQRVSPLACASTQLSSTLHPPLPLWFLLACFALPRLGAGPYFASRVSSSLATAAGLRPLVTHSMREFEDVVVRLSLRPALLWAARAALALGTASGTVPLFLVNHTAASVEQAFAAAVNLRDLRRRGHDRGNAPSSSPPRIPPMHVVVGAATAPVGVATAATAGAAAAAAEDALRREEGVFRLGSAPTSVLRSVRALARESVRAGGA
jgi:hypothetical protein